MSEELNHKDDPILTTLINYQNYVMGRAKIEDPTEDSRIFRPGFILYNHATEDEWSFQAVNGGIVNSPEVGGYSRSVNIVAQVMIGKDKGFGSSCTSSAGPVFDHDDSLRNILRPITNDAIKTSLSDFLETGANMVEYQKNSLDKLSDEDEESIFLEPINDLKLTREQNMQICDIVRDISKKLYRQKFTLSSDVSACVQTELEDYILQKGKSQELNIT